MSMIICQECNYKYSEKAEVCPNCNCPNPKKENEYIQINKINNLEISLQKDIRRLIQIHILSFIMSILLFTDVKKLNEINFIVFIQSFFMFAFVFFIIYSGYKIGYNLFVFFGGLLGSVAIIFIYTATLEYLIKNVNPILGDIIVILFLFLYFLYQYIFPITKAIKLRKIKKQISI